MPVWTRTLIKGPQRGHHPPVPPLHPTCSSLAATMGVKNKGPIPCTLCDSRFASIPNLQQVNCFPTFSGNFTDFSPQHLRDKHGIIVKTQAPPAQAQPPVQEPPVQVKSEPQAQTKNEPQAQAESEPQVQAKSEPQVQAKSEPPCTVRTLLFYG